MPKVSVSSLPVSGLFAVNKPSGPTSMSVINDIKKLIIESRLFVDPAKHEAFGKKPKRKGASRQKQVRGAVKIGQGGTLDPLADGVLVIGVGKGTKKLGGLLDCVKEYRTTCLLGCETDSYDSDGNRVRLRPWSHVTRENIEKALVQFRGTILQKPPIFSALKMDGRPLYEYARTGLHLPRPIEARPATVYSIEIEQWLGSEHNFRWPDKMMTDKEKWALKRCVEEVDPKLEVEDEPDRNAEGVPTAFVLSMKVSSGTYVRSIVHDLSHAVGSSGHVTSLTRLRQGRWSLRPVKDSEDMECVPWNVFQSASEDEGEPDSDGWKPWEREVMDNLELVGGVDDASTEDSPAADAGDAQASIQS